MSLPNLFYTPTRRDLLRLTGRDRQSFLQGMVTNDVLRLQPGDGCYAFMLDATGHILADMRVLNIGESLLLDLEPGTAPFALATLDKYLIMEKVRIADVTAEYGTFTICGNDAADYFAQWYGGLSVSGWRDNQNTILQDDEAVLCRAAIAPIPAYRLFHRHPWNTDVVYMPRNEKGDTEPELPEATLDALRIEAGIPRFGVDLDKTVLAPEARQDDRAVSRKKGCYIGQEIVARIDARGHTNKGLVGFFLDPVTAELPTHNTPVFAPDGKAVGRITSAAHSPNLGVPIALGFLRNEHAAPGTVLALVEPGGASVVVAALPFVAEEK